MKITTLVENTSINENLGSKHGLSLYIQTAKHNVLFDMGSNDLFCENAVKLGIDLANVDIAVISHGHYDHAGALRKFLEINDKAKIYVKKSAFVPHYTKIGFIKIKIGIDKSLIDDRFVFVDDYLQIDDELTLFGNITGNKFHSTSNDKLLAKYDKKIDVDDFCHEQYLVVNCDGKQLLVTGCSHKGIANILDKFNADYANGSPLTVIGGYHLFNPALGKYESPLLIEQIANYLAQFDATYYTCHCTGAKAYEQMKQILADKLNYASAGTIIDFD